MPTAFDDGGQTEAVAAAKKVMQAAYEAGKVTHLPRFLDTDLQSAKPDHTACGLPPRPGVYIIAEAGIHYVTCGRCIRLYDGC